MNTIKELIEDMRSGKMVILVDDESRENEGDLILPADFVTPQAVNFMAREARGLICLSLTGEQIQRLGLPLMVRDDSNLSPNKTAFTVSIEASTGVSTGISAADRAHTIRVAANPGAHAGDIIMPGHIFPIRAQEGGVLKRAGHTEASVDLARLSGFNPAAVICEIMNEDGSMARLPDLKIFAEKHDIKIGTIEDLIQYRLEHESLVEQVAEAPFKGFDFLETHLPAQVKLFKSKLDGTEHLAFVFGKVDKATGPVCVRVHTENILGDVFNCEMANSGRYLTSALSLIEKEGSGVLLYLRQENMGSRLLRKVEALRDTASGLGDDTMNSAFHSDRREYGLGAQILRALGLHEIKLITNNPGKRVGLKGYGIEIVDSISINDDKIISGVLDAEI